MTILFSGGHLTPALALIDFICQHHPQDKIVFIGRLYSQDKLKQLSQEKNELSERHLQFYDLAAPRISDLLSLKIFFSIFKLLAAIAKAGKIIDLEKPQVIMSFGGYLALPIVIAGWLKKIPVVTHEQTRVAGTANRLIGRLAQQVGVAFAETQQSFPTSKTKLVGMPLRLELFDVMRRPTWIPDNISQPILYVTGGNQGSLFINQLISQSIAELSSKFLVIHQCGNPISTHHYEQQLQQVRNQLQPPQQASYVIKPWVNQQDVAWIYQHAQVVISRAGANSVAELASYQLPAILIPLPSSSHQEQQANASWYQHHYTAQILDQRHFSVTEFIKSLDQLAKLKRPPVNLKTVKDLQTKVLADLYELLESVTRK